SEKAREAALRGLQIDDHLAEAHHILGYQKLFREWDFAGAARELRRTLELNPRDVTASRLYADCSALFGDFESGFVMLRRAQQFVPDSEVIAIELGILLYNARRFDELDHHATEIQQRYPAVPLVHWLRGLSLEQQGKYDQAVAQFEHCLQLSPRNPRAVP